MKKFIEAKIEVINLSDDILMTSGGCGSDGCSLDYCTIDCDSDCGSYCEDGCATNICGS